MQLLPRGLGVRQPYAAFANKLWHSFDPTFSSPTAGSAFLHRTQAFELRFSTLFRTSNFDLRTSGTMERILIIEDELPMRTALHDVLAGEEYRVLTASDGEAGLRRALAEKPDLILLDIMMPKLDGFALCAELRQRANSVPILMLTAKGQVEDRVIGLDAGADDYLVKPFSTEELLARVRALLRRVQRRTRAVTLLALGDV